MRNRKFAEHEKDAFIETAQDMGIGPAIRVMGYPTWPTASKWFKERDIPLPTVDSLQERARGLQEFYGDTEKKYVGQAIMDRIQEKIEQESLTADDIKKLTDAYNKAIQTLNLIDGKSVVITETQNKDGADLELLAMIKAGNELREKDLQG